MKKHLLLVFACGNMAAMAQDKEPYMTKPLSGDAIKSVKAQTTGGNISVSSVAAGEARLEVIVKPNNSSLVSLSNEEIRKRLDEDYDLEISVKDNRLSAVARSKRDNMDWRRALNISFRVFVPQNVSTDLATSGGNITLSNISGEQEFRTSGGNLKLDKVSGKIKGRTSGGNITISDLSDNIDLSTSGGNIEAENCSGTIRLSTSGGNVRIRSLKGDIRAETSGGSVKGEDISGELQAHTSGGSVIMKSMKCSLDASTSGGSIDVEMAELGKYLTLHNSGGGIDLTLPKGKSFDLDLSADRVKAANLENFNGKKEDDEIKGKVNNGGIPVKARTSGTIHFSQQ